MDDIRALITGETNKPPRKGHLDLFSDEFWGNVVMVRMIHHNTIFLYLNCVYEFGFLGALKIKIVGADVLAGPISTR